jgi:transmembrane sensor
MPRRPASDINPLVLDEAAEWFVELEGGEMALAERKAFDEWLRRSPEHVRAFLELLPLWEAGASRGAFHGIDAEALIARASSAASNPAASVVPLPVISRERPAAASGSTSSRGAITRVRGGRFRIAAAAAIAAVAVGAATWWQLAAAQRYSTGIAEQRSVMLDDGSTVELNARSRIRVEFTERERSVELLEGQAIFSVAKDASRPFVVHSDGASVQAVGTQFDVYRRRGMLTVTVIEGRVAVRPVHESPGGASQGGAGSTVLLSAGEQTTVKSRRIEVPRRANLAAATAWTQRRMMFQKVTLAEVVDEFNRFNERQLRIEDDRTEAFLVSGTFSSTDPASLLRFLREQPGIRVVETDDEIRIAAAP